MNRMSIEDKARVDNAASWKITRSGNSSSSGLPSISEFEEAHPGVSFPSEDVLLAPVFVINEEHELYRVVHVKPEALDETELLFKGFWTKASVYDEYALVPVVWNDEHDCYVMVLGNEMYYTDPHGIIGWKTTSFNNIVTLDVFEDTIDMFQVPTSSPSEERLANVYHKPFYPDNDDIIITEESDYED